ncbi:MAG: cyclic nucleotide-binding domain-containing protein, partial [Desulfovibrionales bacterium]
MPKFDKNLPLGSKIFQNIFEYLPEKKFVYLYNAGRIEQYDPGEYLIREGGRDEVVYLVLEGEFKIIKNSGQKELVISLLKPGDWIGEMAFDKNSPRIASAVATRGSNVLAIDDEVFETLDLETQLALMRKFNSLASERFDFLVRRQQEFLDQQTRLISIIKSTMGTERYIYSGSDLIQSFIKVVPRLPVYAVNLITMLHDQSVSMEE